MLKQKTLLQKAITSSNLEIKALIKYVNYVQGEH